MTRTSVPSKRLPAAWAVLSVTLALLFVLVAAIALLAWNIYSDAIDRSRVRASSSAQVVSTHIEWLVAASLQSLEEVDRVLGDDLTAISPFAQAEFRLHLVHMPHGIGLSLVGLDGKARFTMGSADDHGGDLKPEDGIDLAKLTSERNWYVSAPVKDTGSAPSSFLIVRRIERDGRAIGVAVLHIPVSVLSDVWASLDLGPGSTVGMMRDDGWLVARFPPAAKPVNLADYVLFTEYLKKAPAGVYDAVSPVDNTQRIVAYRQVPNAPLLVQASVSRDYAMGRLWDQLERMSLFLIPVMIGLGLLLVWVTALLRRDEQMRASLAAAVDRNNLLMREIHHRTKNNLQSVASLIKLQPISEDAKAAMSGRIAAMSAVHEQAYRSDQYSDVDLKDYLSVLVGNIARTAPAGVTVGMTLDEVVIDRDFAQPLGLIVNEVISNAMKHAFTGRESGRITVTLARLSPESAELVIRDDGAGYTPQGEGPGMGSRLIRAFALQLGNDYSYTSENGTRFAIRFAARPAEAAG